MKPRGVGRVYQRIVRDKETGERKKLPTLWIEYWSRGRQYRESSGSDRPRRL